MKDIFKEIFIFPSKELPITPELFIISTKYISNLFYIPPQWNSFTDFLILIKEHFQAQFLLYIQRNICHKKGIYISGIRGKKENWINKETKVLEVAFSYFHFFAFPSKPNHFVILKMGFNIRNISFFYCYYHRTNILLLA